MLMYFYKYFIADDSPEALQRTSVIESLKPKLPGVLPFADSKKTDLEGAGDASTKGHSFIVLSTVFLPFSILESIGSWNSLDDFSISFSPFQIENALK